MKNSVILLVGNPIGAIGGGILGNVAAKKLFKIKSKLGIAGVTLGGVIMGAIVERKIVRR